MKKISTRENGTIKIVTINNKKTMTQQQFKDQCDINNIIKTYKHTGELPLSQKVGKFLDVSNVQDYQTSLNTIIEASQAFENLPSNIRSRFANDPQKLISFMEDATNQEEAIKLGLINNKNEQTQTNETIIQQASQPASVPSQPASVPSQPASVPS